MGYEVIYHYREALDEPGEYDEEVQTKKVKVGQAYDDTTLDILAGKIMAQLARRNILIVDVEIYEYTRKKLSYKEADDGILIKNKKFKFDDGPVVAGVPAEADDPASQLAELLAANPNLLQTLQQATGNQTVVQNGAALPANVATHAAAVPTANGPRRAIRHEVFSPELMLEHKAKEQNLKLTKGKKYPIFQEEQIGMEPLTRTLYTVQDDTGKEIRIGAEYFVPPTTGKLAYEDQMIGGGLSNADDVDLWGGTGAYMDQIPDIRR